MSMLPSGARALRRRGAVGIAPWRDRSAPNCRPASSTRVRSSAAPVECRECGGDIAEPEQIRLAEGRVVALSGDRLLAVPGPGHHVGDGAHRAVAVEHLERQILPGKLPLHALQPQADFPLHHALGGAVARERPADKIVRAGISDVLDDGGVDIAQVDEAAWQVLRSWPVNARAAKTTAIRTAFTMPAFAQSLRPGSPRRSRSSD